MTVKEAEPKYAAQNRKARHDYFIEETLECGLVLTGTEVKALRKGGASIAGGVRRAEGWRPLSPERPYP